MACAEDNSLPDFESGPWIINFSETKCQGKQTFINPFLGKFLEASLPIEKGKTYLGCFRDWLMVFDEATHECFLANMTSSSKVSLPPLHYPLDSLSECALSSPTPPNCTVMFACSNHERFVLHCRPGDKEWTKYAIDFQNDHEGLSGAIFGSKEEMYAKTNWNSHCIVINTAAHVEMTGITMTQPETCPSYHPALSYWVESNGSIFLVRFYLHSHRGLGVTDIDIHCLDTSIYDWRRVESIGGATFFLGANCVAVSSQDAGTQPDYIYLLLFCYDGIRLYSVCLDNQTISFSLLPACPPDDPQADLSSWISTWRQLQWVIPQRFRQEPTKFPLGIISRKFSTTTISINEEKEEMVAPWSGLPVDLLELLVPRVSFVDYLHVRAVCKGWSLIAKPIRDARTHPLLMKTYGGMCRLFDPMAEKQYNVKDVLFSGDNWQSLHFSKHGWVLTTKGKSWTYAVNPFTKEVCKLPKMRGQMFSGISFSSVPKSPDFAVFAIHKQPWLDFVNVMLWRAGDTHWTKNELPCDVSFSLTYSNPVFFENEFYCLGVHGNLGVFNPDDMAWRVLDRPEPVRADAHADGDRFCYLSEFKGDLFAVFRPYDANPIEVYKLDRLAMSWTEVLRLNDVVIFLDNKNAIIKSSIEYGCCNRIYLPAMRYDETQDRNVSVFYDFEDGKYKPGGFYGVTEPINCIWMEPHFT